MEECHFQLKVILLNGRFSRFLNCTNGTKSRKSSHMYFQIMLCVQWFVHVVLVTCCLSIVDVKVKLNKATIAVDFRGWWCHGDGDTARISQRKPQEDPNAFQVMSFYYYSEISFIFFARKKHTFWTNKSLRLTKNFCFFTSEQKKIEAVLSYHIHSVCVLINSYAAFVNSKNPAPKQFQIEIFSKPCQ